MTRFSLAFATVITAAGMASSIPQAAHAEFTAADAAMQERSELYFKTYGAISDLLEATTAYSIARAHDDKHAMHIAAAEMAAASSESAYLAGVLDAEVQVEGTNSEAKELAPKLANLTMKVENKLDPIIGKSDLDALNKLLDSDETASALTELFAINKQVHHLIEG